MSCLIHFACKKLNPSRTSYRKRLNVYQVIISIGYASIDYAGLTICSKIMPINVEYGIGNKEFDNSGRVITAEYKKFLVIIVPRLKWGIQEFVQTLDARKPIVIYGDNRDRFDQSQVQYTKAGFAKGESDKMSELLALGYVDMFRHLYPDCKSAYTFWTYMGNARQWRLDHFIVLERFVSRVADKCIHQQCLDSDHCSITLYLKI